MADVNTELHAALDAALKQVADLEATVAQLEAEPGFDPSPIKDAINDLIAKDAEMSGGIPSVRIQDRVKLLSEGLRKLQVMF